MKEEPRDELNSFHAIHGNGGWTKTEQTVKGAVIHRCFIGWVRLLVWSTPRS